MKSYCTELFLPQDKNTKISLVIKHTIGGQFFNKKLVFMDILTLFVTAILIPDMILRLYPLFSTTLVEMYKLFIIP